jgi:hypothetical protein
MIFKEILPTDIKTSRSFLNQLVDVLQEDISGSTSRRKFQHFITGGIGPGVTSSLFQSVYDQDFTLQTANPIFDVTFGLNPAGTTVTTTLVGTDAAGKYLFPSSSMMMREKIDIYKQYAQALLGDSTTSFHAPFDSVADADELDCAVFISFKRLFARDQIKRETYAMKWYQTASNSATETLFVPELNCPQNLYRSSIFGSSIYTDVGSSNNKLVAFGGQVGNLVDAALTTRTVGLIFYDRGIVVLNLASVISASQFATGSISAMHPAGITWLGGPGTETYRTSKFIPDFVTSGSMDDILDHVCYSRMQSGSLTAVTFQNVTNINSTLVFCRATSDEFNYSANPTFVDANNRITVIDPGAEDSQTAFVFITGVGLYDSNDNLLAMAKLSRPLEKNAEKDLTLRLRLDYVKRNSSIHISR